MSLISKMRKQKAIYFARKAEANRFGEFEYENGVIIKCRWDDSQIEFTDAEGQRQTSAAVVYVDRVVKPGDLLLKADTLPAWNGVENPRFQEGVKRIAKANAFPNLKNTESIYPTYTI